MTADLLNGVFGSDEGRSVSTVGSYDVKYHVMAVDPKSRKAVVAWEVSNQLDTKSLCRNPTEDKEKAKNIGPKEGRLSPLKMKVHWAETIDF